MLTIPIQNQSHHPLPSYQTDQSAGLDLRAYIPKPITIPLRGRVLVPTGLYIALPRGYEGQVRPRSGLALRSGVTVLNTPGTIDADYRGEIKVILVNLGEASFVVEDGARIAQLVIAPCLQITWSPLDTLPSTDRSSEGFGSTGMH